MPKRYNENPLLTASFLVAAPFRSKCICRQVRSFGSLSAVILVNSFSEKAIALHYNTDVKFNGAAGTYSGALRLTVWGTRVPYAQAFEGYQMGVATFPSLQASAAIQSLDDVAPLLSIAGAFYTTLVLEENTSGTWVGRASLDLGIQNYSYKEIPALNYVVPPFTIPVGSLITFTVKKSEGRAVPRGTLIYSYLYTPTVAQLSGGSLGATAVNASYSLTTDVSFFPTKSGKYPWVVDYFANIGALNPLDPTAQSHHRLYFTDPNKGYFLVSAIGNAGVGAASGSFELNGRRAVNVLTDIARPTLKWVSPASNTKVGIGDTITVEVSDNKPIEGAKVYVHTKIGDYALKNWFALTAEGTNSIRRGALYVRRFSRALPTSSYPPSGVKFSFEAYAQDALGNMSSYKSRKFIGR